MLMMMIIIFFFAKNLFVSTCLFSHTHRHIRWYEKKREVDDKQIAARVENKKATSARMQSPHIDTNKSICARAQTQRSYSANLVCLVHCKCNVLSIIISLLILSNDYELVLLLFLCDYVLCLSYSRYCMYVGTMYVCVSVFLWFNFVLNSTFQDNKHA